MATKKAATAEAEPKVEEQEPNQEPETASPPEAEPQEQRGDETPDPLAEVTFEQLQEHPRFKEHWENLTRAQKEAQEKAWREGQSAGAKQADQSAREYAAQQEAIKAFETLEQKRNSQDPDDLQEYANAMGDPKKKETYERGRAAKQGPSRDQLEAELIITIMGGVDSSLDERLSKQGELSDVEKARVDKGKFKTLPELTQAKIDLLVERGIAAGVKEASEQHDKEVADTARQELLDELGMEAPEGIEGKKPKREPLPTKEEVDKMSVDQLRKLEREGKLDKILAKQK